MSDSSAFILAGEEIVEMFRVDLPRMTESDLAQVLLRLRTPELEVVRGFLEPVAREELQRRRVPLPVA
jgi:hypothetical protein